MREVLYLNRPLLIKPGRGYVSHEQAWQEEPVLPNSFAESGDPVVLMNLS